MKCPTNPAPVCCATRVPFQQALPLVAGRIVYLERGFAYVPLQRLVSIIVTKFRIQLSRALAEAANSFDIVGSDGRIGPLLKVSSLPHLFLLEFPDTDCAPL
jgi:DNA primase large subunit